MGRDRGSIAKGQPHQALEHGDAIYFKLPVGKGIAGQRVHRGAGTLKAIAQELEARGVRISPERER
jgi:hypothetical protein